jgi:bifunctional N-acetylglucosamine-1-phosphate-uridyltransferase/glucosamine-1-phosphate-acetyltransferase GlmU-like protein
VIVNGRYGDDIRSSLSDHPEDHFVHQSERSGTAGAVKLVLDVIGKNHKHDAFGHMVVLYGDMPCWRRESIEYLVTSHLEHQHHPAISMFGIQLNNCCPELVRRYGRILYDADGELIGIREPYEMTADELCRARTVNPSAWVFDLAWLRDAIALLRPHDKGDGFAEEYWLPDLAPLAIRDRRVINVLPLTDPREALGVNTLEELFEVQQLLTKQRGAVVAT